MNKAALHRASEGSDAGREDSTSVGPPGSHDTTAQSAASGGAIASASASIVTAMASSACCWVPLALIGLGASAGGVAGFFQRWRPILAPLSIGMVALSFFLAYRRPRGCSGKGACCDRPTRIQRVSRVTTWISAVVVLAFVLFPNYATGLMRRVSATPAPVTAISEGGDGAGGIDADSPAAAELTFDVEGMTCDACAVGLEGQLQSLPAVRGASVDYKSKTIRVQSGEPDAAQEVIDAADRLGFKASLRRDDPTNDDGN